MDENLCNIHIRRDSNSYHAIIQTDLGGVREYNSKSFEGLLEQIVLDLQEEFEPNL
jgi:hypothetical protein